MCSPIIWVIDQYKELFPKVENIVEKEDTITEHIRILSYSSALTENENRTEIKQRLNAFKFLCTFIVTKEKNMKPENSCNIKRWDLLKQQLQNLPPKSFQQQLGSHPNAILIDVRTPAEFSSNHLPGALNMDYLGGDYWKIFDQLDRSAPIFVYCRTGRRSVRTAMFMKNGGFEQVYNLDGGLIEWESTFGSFSASE